MTRSGARYGQPHPVGPEFEGGVLNDREILSARRRGAVVVDPFDATSLRPAALALHLGADAVVLRSDGPVDTADRRTYPRLVPRPLDRAGCIAVHPGEVVLVPTHERVGLADDLVGIMDGTSDLARLGISVVLSHQVSPGFGMPDGAVLTLEIVSRLGHTVILHPGTRVGNLMVFRCAPAVRSYRQMPHHHSRSEWSPGSRLADHLESRDVVPPSGGPGTSPRHALRTQTGQRDLSTRRLGRVSSGFLAAFARRT